MTLYDTVELLERLEAEVDRLTLESAGRLKVLEEKAAEAKEEWQRAEQAEQRTQCDRIVEILHREQAKFARVVEFLEMIEAQSSTPAEVKVARAALAAAREQPEGVDE